MASQAVGIGASLLSGIFGGKGAKKAAKANAAQLQAALAQQQRQYDTTRSDLMPYMSAGGGALASSLDLLGQNGNDVQQTAIDHLKASPSFTSLYNTGQDTLLQNAAATGGLRGGDTQRGLADFGSSLLAQVIQSQLGNLGGIANLGAGAAGQLGGIGQSNANAQTGIYGQLGQANGISAGAPYAALQGIFSGIGGNVRSGAGAISGMPGHAW